MPEGWFFEDDPAGGEFVHEDCPAVAGPGQDELRGCIDAQGFTGRKLVQFVLCKDCGEGVSYEVANGGEQWELVMSRLRSSLRSLPE